MGVNNMSFISKRKMVAMLLTGILCLYTSSFFIACTKIILDNKMHYL